MQTRCVPDSPHAGGDPELRARTPPVGAAGAAEPSRRTIVASVALCCLATLLVKLQVNAIRTAVNHGDSSFYYVVAKNLATGRGFVLDYIWNFWNDPQGLPAPSNDWWMPLTSIIGAIGMRLGSVDYVSAQTAMIVATSILPLIVYLLGRELFGSALIGLVGAALSVGFHLFLDQPSALLSQGPYVVLASLSLWLAVRTMRAPSSLPWAGAAIALTQLARSDGIVLFGPLAVAVLLARPRPGPGQLGGALLGYALVMAPWWLHNLSAYGALMPTGAFRAVWLLNYEQWYSLPSTVTAEHWLAQGWPAIWAAKWSMAGTNLRAFLEGLVVGAPMREKAYAYPALTATLVLAAPGALSTFRRRFLPFWTLALAEWVFYSLVFTAVGIESFRIGMYSLYPTLLLCAAATIVWLGRWVGRLLGRRLPTGRAARAVPAALGALLVGWILVGQVRFAHLSMEQKVAGINDLNDVYRTMRTRMFDYLGLSDEIIMARDVHQLNAIAGMKGLMIPFESEPVIRQVAQRYGCHYLMLFGDPEAQSLRPSLHDIETNPHFERISEAKMKGIHCSLYRILD